MNQEDQLNKVRLYMQEQGFLLHRNNVGYLCVQGRHIRYGVGGRGGSDLIGMSKMGNYTAVEVKLGKSKVSKDQLRFLKGVAKNKGFAFVARIFENEIKLERII